MPGLSVDPGSGVVVTGSYVVGAVQAQVVLQGAVGRRACMVGGRSSQGAA